MTKQIRIENADNSTWKIKVTTQEKRWDATLNKLSDEWEDTETNRLDYPTNMLTSFLTTTRRFIIEEDGCS